MIRSQGEGVRFQLSSVPTDAAPDPLSVRTGFTHPPPGAPADSPGLGQPGSHVSLKSAVTPPT